MKRKLHLLGYMIATSLFFTGCKGEVKETTNDVTVNTPTVAVTTGSSTKIELQPSTSPENDTLSLVPTKGAITPDLSTPGVEVTPALPEKEVSLTPTLALEETNHGDGIEVSNDTSNASPQDKENPGVIRLLEDNTQAQLDEEGTVVGVRISGNNITITQVITEPRDSIIIPATIEGYQVTTIESLAFHDSKATHIKLESGIKRIESRAFYGNNNIVKVSIPDTVNIIGQNAFGNCSNLTVIELAKENKDYTLVDGVLYNKEKTSLLRYPAGRNDETLMLPDTVVKIGDGAFSLSKNLAFIIFPTSLRSIGYEAFAGCTILNIDIPQTIVELKAYAFADCYQLHSITIPKGVHVIPEAAFSGCENVFRVEFLGHINQISCSAFANCTSLNKIIFSNTVDVIGELSFAFCTSLKNIAVPEGTIEISDMAFYACSNLEEIRIPTSVTYFGQKIFEQAMDVKVLAPRGSKAVAYSILNRLELEVLD